MQIVCVVYAGTVKPFGGEFFGSLWCTVGFEWNVGSLVIGNIYGKGEHIPSVLFLPRNPTNSQTGLLVDGGN